LKQMDPELRYQYFETFNTTTLFIRKPIAEETILFSEIANLPDEETI